MKKKHHHSSVSGLVNSLAGKAFAEEFAKRLCGRRFIKTLMVLRTRAGLSQKELAERLNCTQSKVSKLESSEDADICFGDLVRYANAVGYEVCVGLTPKGQTLVDDVKLHAFAIKQDLDTMVELAGDDGVIGAGVARFLEEAAFNLVRLIGMAAEALPALPEQPSIPLRVRAPDISEEEIPPDDCPEGPATCANHLT